jgi:hypothetical protein
MTHFLFYCYHYYLLLLLLPFTVVIFSAVVILVVDIAAAAAAADLTSIAIFVADSIIHVALFHHNTLFMHTCNFRVLFAMVIVREVTSGNWPYMSSLRSL